MTHSGTVLLDLGRHRPGAENLFQQPARARQRSSKMTQAMFSGFLEMRLLTSVRYGFSCVFCPLIRRAVTPEGGPMGATVGGEAGRRGSPAAGRSTCPVQMIPRKLVPVPGRTSAVSLLLAVVRRVGKSMVAGSK